MRVQPRQGEVLLELARNGGERHRHVHAAHLERRLPRAEDDRPGRRGAWSAGDDPASVRAGVAARSPPRANAATPSPTARTTMRDQRTRRRRARCGAAPGAAVAESRVQVVHGGGTLAQNVRIGTRERGRPRVAAVVLSDRTIRRRARRGPDRDRPFDEALLQPSSVDVRVDRYFRVFHNARYPFIDVKQPQEDLTELVEVEDETPFILHPGEFVLGSTLERITLPDDLVARLEGKSSLGPPRPPHPLDRRLHRSRLGRPRHARALERRQPPDHDLLRHEDRPALVRPADASPRRRPTAASGLGSKYQGQRGPTPSRYWKNFE